MGKKPVSLPVCRVTWKRRGPREGEKQGHGAAPTNERAKSGQGEGGWGTRRLQAVAKPLQTQRRDYTWMRLLEKPAEGGRQSWPGINKH